MELVERSTAASGVLKQTPAQQFEAAAVQTAKDSAERYQARLTSEEAMKDTEMPLTHIGTYGGFGAYGRRVEEEAEVVRNAERIATETLNEAITLRRDNAVLVKRIEELEAYIDSLGHRDVIAYSKARIEELQAERDQSRLANEEQRLLITSLEAEVDELRGTATPCLETLERLAHTLKRFYFADLSLSSVQPIIAMCLELNPDIVEQKR
jgi:hypothetical protein